MRERLDPEDGRVDEQHWPCPGLGPSVGLGVLLDL